MPRPFDQPACRRVLGVIAVAASLCACATRPPPGPTLAVIPKAGESLAEFQQHDAACRTYASGSIGKASSQAPDFSDVLPIARALIDTNRDRLLWGTNWPHPSARRVPGRAPTDIAPLRHVDDGRIMNLLRAWAPDPADRRAILVDNPARLYGFGTDARV